jgi:hypothetical protein
MAYDGAGSLFALGLRLTKLDPAGAPLVGADNSYTTESLVAISMGNTYSEPDTIELRNGAGITCVYYAPPPTLLGGTIEDMRVCTPDPYILQFCCGGEIITVGGTSEVQTVTITGTPTGGTFTLTFSGQTTGSIAYNAAAAAVQTALVALSNINPGDVTVGGGPGPGTPYTVTFGGQYASTDVAQMTANGSFTGGTVPAIAVTTTTPGVPGATAIGYRAPEVNVDPTPNGVAIEAWSRAVVDNAFAASLPYFHWVLPRAKLRPSEALALGAEDPTTPTLSGTTEQNAGFGDGPTGDIGFPTDRIYQYSRVASIPDLSAGLVEVVADES